MQEKRQTPPDFEEDQILVRSLAAGYSPSYVIHAHSHEWGQLIYASRGVMSVHTEASYRVVPPNRAVWVPAGIEHRVEMSGAVSMRTLYFAPSLTDAVPAECSVLNVSPLLRELILHVVSLGMLDRRLPEHDRLIGVLLDQLRALDTVPLQLPMPRDRRASMVAKTLQANPGDTSSLEQLARRSGATKRTIERRFNSETGLTFGRWRQQLVLLHALKLLASGESVTSVALELGYESTSAFISMFKRALGSTPRRYYEERQSA
jgi:AraC-like DNA-binding protein